MQEIKSIVFVTISHGKQEEGEIANNYERAMIPQVRFIKCPIKASLGVLGTIRNKHSIKL